jgi:glycogen synthase
VPVTVSEYGDRYCLIGPLSYKTAPMEVETLPLPPLDPPATPSSLPPNQSWAAQDYAFARAVTSMRQMGVKCLYGRWLIESNPRVLLFDTGSMYHKIDEWKGDLWNLAGIPTPPNDHETNETVIFGYLVAWFLGEVSVQPCIPPTVARLSLRHDSI